MCADGVGDRFRRGGVFRAPCMTGPVAMETDTKVSVEPLLNWVRVLISPALRNTVGRMPRPEDWGGGAGRCVSPFLLSRRTAYASACLYSARMSNFALVAGAVALAALAPGPTVNGVTPPPDPWYSKPPNSQAWRHHTSNGQAPPARFLREPRQRKREESRRPDTPAHPPKKPAPEAGYRARLVRLVNQERKKGHCPAVRQHSALNQAAQGHSVYMALTQILSHTERGGPDPGERVKAADYRFRLAGENILSGARNPAAAVRAWMASPEHRRSILTCSFRHVGIGRETGGKGPWWTLLLAAPR